MPEPVVPRRSAAKQQAILAAATALVAEQGYATVTMEAVAARAGVGKQTLYRWWPSKPALFLEAYAGLVPRDALVAEEQGSAAAELHTLLARLFALFRSTPAAAILAGLIGAAPADAAARAAVTSGLVLGRQDLLSAPLRRGIARGELPPGFDVAQAAKVITALIWQEVLLHPARLDEAEAGTILRCALAAGRAGLATEASDAA